MALEGLAWPAEPADTDEVDGGQSYNMGTLFGIAAGGSATDCFGVQWRVPDAVSAPSGGVHAAALWDVASSTRLAYKEFTPAPGGYQDILFDDSVPIPPFTEFIACVYTVHYVYRSSAPPTGWHVFSPSGNIDAYQSRLADTNIGAPAAPMPTNTPTLWFYVAPITGSESTDPETSGTAGVTFGASAVTGASKPTTGAGVLTVAGSAAVATSRLASGTAALTATATSARTTSRTTTGRAELAAGASAARSSVRVTSGVAGVLFGASATQVRGGGGPRLVTVGRASRLTSVTRPSAISTSTRG